MRARHSAAVRELWLPLQGFLHAQRLGGAITLAAAVAALAWANSPWGETYVEVWATELALRLGSHELALDLKHWVNEGLMALFFLSVGLEIKRELTEGELSSKSQAVLPMAAAVGGMAVPALFYLLLAGDRVTAGWGIPVATDIAFAVAVLSLLGDRIETGVKVFLLGIAIVDDILAILVIAFFYSTDVALLQVVAAALLIAAVAVLSRVGVRTLWVHVPLGIAVWLAVLHSGVHATLAGVALALVTPSSPPLARTQFRERVRPLLDAFDEAVEDDDREAAEASLGQVESLTRDTESALDRALRHLPPFVALGVMPLFALANAGIPLSLASIADSLATPLSHGIIAGLVLGKPIGIVLGTVLAIVLLGARLPRGVDLWRVVGVGLVAGIGFTVALFIAELAFAQDARLDTAKIAVLTASLVAALVGAGTLLLVSGRPLASFGRSSDEDESDLSGARHADTRDPF